MITHKKNCDCDMCEALKILMNLDEKEESQVLLAWLTIRSGGIDDIAIGILEKMKMNLIMNNLNPKEFMNYIKTKLGEEKHG